MVSEIHVSAQVFKNYKPDIKVFFKDGTEIILSEIILSPSGEIISVISTDGHEYFKDDIDICQNFLEVPGVGFLKPGSIVRIKGQEYILNYGDHTNISNQRLISWYLTPHGAEMKLDPLGRATAEDRTLYVSMINDIDLVTA